jgi:4-carboxymuconolactone decarboxylase
MSTNEILHLSEQHPEHQELILLSAISVLWLGPQNSSAADLIRHYRECDFSFAALREAALQLFLLAGFQASLEAAFQIEEIYGHGLSDATETDLDAQQWHSRGQELQAAVYRGNVEKLRANLNRVSPELSVWTVLIGYGLVLSRPGMPPHWRELLEIAVLSVQGFSRQLHSHLRGALNLGASPEEVDLVLQTTSSLSTKERHDAALRMWRKIRS